MLSYSCFSFVQKRTCYIKTYPVYHICFIWSVQNIHRSIHYINIMATYLYLMGFSCAISLPNAKNFNI